MKMSDTNATVLSSLDNMNQVAINRFDDAIGIQAGACNMSGVTRSLVRCINQCRAENVDVRSDAAIRMIVHQMAFLCGVGEIDNSFEVYGELTKIIEAKAAEYKAKATTK
jgi:hypothetical protein